MTDRAITSKSIESEAISRSGPEMIRFSDLFCPPGVFMTRSYKLYVVI